MNRHKLFRIAYLILLSATGFFLPLSVFLLSALTIALVSIWLLSLGFEKFRIMKVNRRGIPVFLFIYLVYLGGMITTQDIQSGLQELRIMLPVLVFPLIVGLSYPLSSRDLKIVITFFIAGVVVSSLIGTGSRLFSAENVTWDPRELSLFISHIRLSLMAVLAIFSSAYYFLNSSGKFKWDLLYLVTAIWLTIFLMMLLSLTGIIIFIAVFCISVVAAAIRTRNRIKIYSAFAIVTIVLLSIFITVARSIRSFYTPGNSYKFPLENNTLSGRAYTHDTIRNDTENGNLVWIYLNEEELGKEWNKVSRIPYDSLDMKGQDIRYTITRYLTSAGFRKDSLGISMLNNNDIVNIENGIANIIYAEGKPVKAKLYELIWQIDYYRRGGNPSGHSVTQRFEFLKTAWHIFLSAPLFGTGTGDQGTSFSLQYELERSVLDTSYRLQAHNQYLTFLVMFGVCGFLIIMGSIFYPYIRTRGFRDYLTTIFLIIILISMLGEDTLETHTGVSFFAYFYSVFIFGRNDDES